MANQLNIKTEEAYRLAAALARMTGESLTTAVTEALKERLDREQHKRDSEILKSRLSRIATEIRSSLKRAGSRDGLYDERGLPR
jgi:antitoxin VapB